MVEISALNVVFNFLKMIYNLVAFIFIIFFIDRYVRHYTKFVLMNKYKYIFLLFNKLWNLQWKYIAL